MRVVCSVSLGTGSASTRACGASGSFVDAPLVAQYRLLRSDGESE
jgi:hypothetical protein